MMTNDDKMRSELMEDMDREAVKDRARDRAKWFRAGMLLGLGVALEHAGESENLEELMMTLVAILAPTVGDEQ